jgi:hypothetical protein
VSISHTSHHSFISFISHSSRGLRVLYIPILGVYEGRVIIENCVNYSNPVIIGMLCESRGGSP